jgi:hypothetical protein
MATVHGMDYSATVIATMQERAKTGKYQQLQYFQVRSERNVSTQFLEV